MVNTKIVLIRHGEIEANVTRRWHGSTDSALNQNGLNQAEAMAAHVAVRYPALSAIYSSPLQRTRNTAKPLASKLGVRVRLDDDLREYSIGVLEDTPYHVLHEQHRFFESIAADDDFAPPGGESLNQVCTRMMIFLSRLQKQHTGQCVAVVSHGAAMAIALSHMLEARLFPFSDYHMGNTSFSELDWSARPELQFFNNSEHLSGGD